MHPSANALCLISIARARKSGTWALLRSCQLREKDRLNTHGTLRGQLNGDQGCVDYWGERGSQSIQPWVCSWPKRKLPANFSRTREPGDFLRPAGCLPVLAPSWMSEVEGLLSCLCLQVKTGIWKGDSTFSSLSQKMTASEQAVARITRNQHSNPCCSPSQWPGLICRWHCNSGVLEAAEERRAFAFPSAGFDTFPPDLCFIMWHILELENGPWQVHVEERERGLSGPITPRLSGWQASPCV